MKNNESQSLTAKISSALALVFLVFVPVFILAVSGVWYVDAKRLADADVLRSQQTLIAEAEAQAISLATQAAAINAMVEINTRFAQSGAQSVRTYYLPNRMIDLPVIYDANNALIFPEAQEMQLFSEDVRLRQGAAHFAAARQMAQNGELVWVGSVLNSETPIVACQAAKGQTLCLMLNSEALETIARTALKNGQLLSLASDEVKRPGFHQAIAMLPAPFFGIIVAIDANSPTSNPWLQVAAIVLPTFLGSAVAALGLISVHRSRLQAADQRANILAEISHDLRTPLANLRLYAGLLRAHRSNPDKVTQHAAVIEAETTRLNWSIDNALSLYQSGPSNGACNAAPATVILSLIERYKPLFQGNAPITLALSAVAPVHFDVSVFEHVLINLLDNAHKHTAGSALHLSCWQDETTLRLKLSDQGVQGPRQSDGLNGFGLGLRACKTRAQAAGGDFAYRLDTASGSWFELSLPILPPPQPEVCPI